VRVEHLASHILGLVVCRLNADWQAQYGHPIHLIETFAERDRFRGTCYRVANGLCVGQTRGRSRQDHNPDVARSRQGHLPLSVESTSERRSAMSRREEVESIAATDPPALVGPPGHFSSFQSAGRDLGLPVHGTQSAARMFATGNF
jgi:hypothetical protein